MSNTNFLIVFLLFMVPTYFWRFVVVFGDSPASAEPGDMTITMNVLLFISYAVMTKVSFSRGKAIGKGYIGSFPIVSGVFDMVVPFVPFVPTIMNIITIVLAMPNPKESNNN